MDDQRTRDELDALADLFLTGTLPTDRPSSVSVDAAPAAKSEHAPAAGTSVLDELDGPESYRLPAQRVTTRSPSGQEGENVGKVLGGNVAGTIGGALGGATKEADRRLRTRMPQPTAGARVGRAEAVFLGNLPGFAGPWLSQYAHDVTLQHGPVGLLRLDNQRVELELLTAQGAAGWSDESFDDDGAGGHSATLADRMAALAQTTGDEGFDSDESDVAHAGVARWLVSLPNQPSGLTRLAARYLTHWTFVLGADDMAVSAAARMIAQLVRMDDIGEPKQIAAVIMGSDEVHSRAAVIKLNDALGADLNIEVAFAGWRQRMRPVHLERVAGESMTDAVWSQLAMFFDSLDAEATVGADRAGQVDQMPGVIDTASPIPPRPRADAPVPQPPAMSTPAAAPSADSPSRPAIEDEQDMVHPAIPAMPAAASTPPAPIAPSRREEPAAATREAALDLCQFLADTDIAGAVRMEARCPDHPATQLVIDETGRLHLLVQHQAAGSPSNGSSAGRTDAGASLRSAMMDLIETRNWAVRHIDLLRLTQRQCAFDAQAAPVLHIFTGNAKVAASLIPSLGGDVKLHLLKQVSVAGQSAWFSTELN